MSNQQIPDISDERLKELYDRIRPIRKDILGKKRWLKEYSLRELRLRNFIWDSKDMTTTVAETGVKLRPIGTFKCLHAWDKPALFMPSVAEVLAQIPDGLIQNAFAFEIIDMPNTISDCYADPFSKHAFENHCHVSTIQLYALG